MNTKFIATLSIAAALAAPTFAFAQSSTQPATRASVRADLVQLEQAGYNPGTNQSNYPSNIQAAEHRVSVENGMNSAGSSTSGSSQSGAPAGVQGQSSTIWSHAYYPDTVNNTQSR